MICGVRVRNSKNFYSDPGYLEQQCWNSPYSTFLQPCWWCRPCLVISVRNPVHAALFLILSFFCSAAIWLILKAEFLAIALVLVYVGAVMVLFLFVVMMLDINGLNAQGRFFQVFTRRVTGCPAVCWSLWDWSWGTAQVAPDSGPVCGAGCRGRRKYPVTRPGDVHRIHLPLRGRRRDPAGRDYRRRSV